MSHGGRLGRRITDGIHTDWKKWCTEVDKLRNIQIPRRYTESLPSQSCFFTLHIFADASPIAYGTVAYLSGTDEHDNTTSTILISKSRIAPVKTLTLARLELMACVLSARLYTYLQRHLKVRLEEVVFWSDSTIGIHWINGEPSRWKTFVRNRVEDIQRHTDATQWRHCSGKENPADLVTRGVSATNLVYSTLWWNGPEWIRESKENWPRGKTDGVQYQSSEEKAVKETGVIQTQVAETAGNALLDVESYSSLHRLLKATAWILRYVRNSRPGRRTSGPITVTELAEAEKHWTKHVQGQCFATEIKCTLENRKLPANPPLRTVTLFIDKEGLLRINGRLLFSGKGYDEQHAIVLPKTHHLSTLVVRGCHRQVLHSGVRDTLVQVRERH
ncbi:uncharacterized protein LOC135389499 [Ornithodoros turicata]|uniref:uncharacterized protein LOC135389499 n=1 Tax=Ornithodoros turicata TaxID=34597 RepID=UPI0031392479